MTTTRSIRGAFCAMLVAAVLLPTAARLRGQEPPTPVTTPAAAAQPADVRPSPNVPTAQAVPVQQVPSPASPTHAPDQVMWALIASYGMQYLKGAKWFPFLKSESTARLKAQFGFALAALTAAGVHFVITGDILDGSGATLTITGISADVIKDLAFQWASQQAWFDLLVHRRVPTAAA